MLNQVFIIIASCLPAQVGDSITASQLLNLLGVLHEPLHDVSFVYEGEMKYVGPAGLKGSDLEKIGHSFQGNFAYRSDGSLLFEKYTTVKSNGFRLHLIFTKLGDKISEAKENPLNGEWRVLNARARQGVSYANDITFKYSYINYFKQLVSPDDFGYEFEGWESIDGRRCLRLRIDLYPQSPNPNRPDTRFWIDMDRGGNPSKVEIRRGDKLVTSVRMELQSFAGAGGKPIWLPIREEISNYTRDGECYDYPIFQEIGYIVAGSLQLNRDLPDSTFVLDARDPARTPARLSKAIRAARAGNRPLLRTDPEGVKKELDRKLAEAKQQARQLDASAPEDGRAWTTYISRGLLIAGAIGIIVAAAANLRRRLY
jgi:hypothetical protein